MKKRIFLTFFINNFIKRLYLCLMLRVSLHIERLLLFNDCVIIPDFGGFVLQIHSAVYELEKHTFSPPYKETVFNPTLKHNDGLLSESYMQLYNMDFNEAQSAMKSDIDILKKELEQHETVSIGKIGVFRKQEALLLFEPNNDTLDLNVSSYGLMPFYLPPVQVEMSEAIINVRETSEVGNAETKAGRIIYLPPVNKILSRAAGIAAAAIAIFLLISTPVKDVNQSAYTASFIPSEMVPKWISIQKDLHVDEAKIQDESNEDDMADTTIMTSISVPSAAIPPLENQSIMSTEASFVRSNLSMPEIEPITIGVYYVIIASLDSEKELARFFSDAVSSELKNVGIVRNNNRRIRVYADKTTDRKSAEAYVQLLRENEKYKDTWLFLGQ